MKFKTVICGGTFDLLHAGHKYFLEQVLKLSEKVIIGLTSDKYILENKSNKGIASFTDRKKNLELFLESLKAGERVKIIQIDNFYGPLLDSNFQVDALIISEHRENAVKINDERQSRGLPLLPILEVNLWRGENRKKISSSRIREGEIDREGKNLILPSTLRPLLQDALGEILEDVSQNQDPNKTITVGDVTTAKFRNLKILPKISIIDFKVGRKISRLPFPASWRVRTRFRQAETGKERVINVKNPAGTISKDLTRAVREALESDSSSVIIVDGEEDLAVLPCLLYAPLGFQIFYGQPNVGLVRIKVTKVIKKKARELIDKFDKA